jgi:hypothetical protein
LAWISGASSEEDPYDSARGHQNHADDYGGDAADERRRDSPDRAAFGDAHCDPHACADSNGGAKTDR